jgi:uncharacterized protein with HEPN domain
MRKDDTIYIGHMMDMAVKAVEKTKNLSREAFDLDENLCMALTHLLQVFGEAARRVSTDFQSRHSEIPWRKIIGMRHKIVHDYMYVDFDIVWDVVMHELPSLLPSLEKISLAE